MYKLTSSLIHTVSLSETWKFWKGPFICVPMKGSIYLGLIVHMIVSDFQIRYFCELIFCQIKHSNFASLVAISGPQKVSISRAHPFQWPSKLIYPHQNHYVLCHINISYINIYFFSICAVCLPASAPVASKCYDKGDFFLCYISYTVVLCLVYQRLILWRNYI